MTTNISRGQVVITCDLCAKPTQQFCKNCQVSLCVDCVSKHVDKHQSLTHDILPFKNRKIQFVFPECEFYPHQRCEAHCQKCDVPVCIKCFLGNHKGNDAVELSNIVENKKGKIEKKTKEIEIVIIPRYLKSALLDIMSWNRAWRNVNLQLDRRSLLFIYKLLDKGKVIAIVPTAVKPIWRVACVGENAAWISGDDIFIKLVDIHGFVQDIVKTTSLETPNDITVTRQNDLVYSDAKTRTVNIVRNGLTEVMFTTQKGWKPRGLCCTRLGDILVNLYDAGQNKIVRYQGQMVKQEIHKDKDKNEILKMVNIGFA
ncbi:uncharacterized protein LOC133194463 [Saccostrea echinata]|uniref:uncharacterized protein LOC133194463 n=1 Tax=Saccostrea echinata TaxID=191078 RepID=UPI002A8057CA|nr:uncharacterized protein LOC133194463 [Saccostrea echinata]